MIKEEWKWLFTNEIEITTFIKSLDGYLHIWYRELKSKPSFDSPSNYTRWFFDFKECHYKDPYRRLEKLLLKKDSMIREQKINVILK